MFRGYRVAFIAIAGLILAGASPPTKQQKEAAAADKQKPAEAVPAVSDEYKPHSNKYAESCYYANNHDSADLCAQWRAAIAAEKAAYATTWANWISAVGAILSFVSIVLVFIALGQTRKANRLTMKANARSTRQAVASAAETEKALEVARSSANAMTKQVEVHRQNAERQLRPYLYIEKILPERPNEQFKTVEIHVKNFGQTPATDLKVIFGFGIYTVGAALWPVPSSSSRLMRDVAPGHFQRAIIGSEFTSDEVALLIKGEAEIHITFLIEYAGFGIDGLDKLKASIVFTSEGPRVDVYEKEGNLI